MSKFSRSLKHKNAYHEKRHSLRVSFKGLNCAGDHTWSSIWIPINNISSLYMHMQIYIYMYIHNSCMRAYALVQQLLCHGFYCELILSLVRTSSRPPAPSSSRPPSCRPVAWRCSLKKSVKIHASSWCCTSIIWSSALVRVSSSLSMVHTRAWPRTSPSTKNIFSQPFLRAFWTGQFFCCHLNYDLLLYEAITVILLCNYL